MINWQTGNAGVAGFLSGVGGALTLPVSIPANLASSLFFQLRLAAGIAKIRGYDPRSDQAKSMAIACLVGSSAVKTLQSAGVVIGSKLAHQAVNSISREVIVKINQAVGFRLLTKFGHTGAGQPWQSYTFCWWFHFRCLRRDYHCRCWRSCKERVC